MKILGISAFYHDSAAALVCDGKVLFASEEERYTRKKGDASFPRNAIEAALKDQGLRINELDAVVFYEKPWMKLERILALYACQFPKGAKHFLRKAPDFLNKSLFLRKELNRELRLLDSEWSGENLKFSEHHLSHAAASYFCSPFPDCAGLVVDGVGEWATTSLFSARGDYLKIEKTISFPHSLGLFYSAATAFCGFKVNSGEYKLMGLAPYGRPIFKDRILDKILAVNEDGSFHLLPTAFDFFSQSGHFSSEWESIFKRKARGPSDDIMSFADVAASIQKALEEALISIVGKLRRESESKNLCLGGGVALNCVANTVILRESGFKNLWIQPAAGDAGGAIGAALAFFYDANRSSIELLPRPSVMKDAFLGTSESHAEVLETLKKYNIAFTHLSEAEVVHEIAKKLSSGKVLAHHYGRMEFGPRALGHRSIFADPRGSEMRERLNKLTKLRESFRPFAPIILEEEFSNWFGEERGSEFMLLAPQVISELAEKVPAVIHVDGSARVQIVSKERNARTHAILSAFQKLTGCPILVNTSFNVRGEPIVRTAKDALRSFFECGIDCLVIGNCLVEKQDQRSVPEELLQKAYAED